MIQAAICDSRNMIVNQIEDNILNLCHLRGIEVEIDVFYADAALERSILTGCKYDIIYLDIQMENGSGIAQARRMRKIDENALLICVSEYGQYMVELFQLDVFAFITKPIQEDVLSDVFLSAYHKICNKKFYFSFRYKSEYYKILCKDILYFESIGRKIRIYLQNGEVEVFNGKLSEVEARLSGGKIPFVRIHQSFLVNYYLIKARSRTEVTLVNRVKLPISEERQKSFSRQYKKLLEEKSDI